MINIYKEIKMKVYHYYSNEFNNSCKRFELSVEGIKFYKNIQNFLLYLSENQVIGGWEFNDVNRKNFYYKLTMHMFHHHN